MTQRNPFLLLGILLGILLGTALDLRGQGPPDPLPRPAGPGALLPAAYTDPEGALLLLAPLRHLDPEGVELHLATAREATAMGLLSPTPDDRMRWLGVAAEAARDAVVLDGTRADTHFWLAASLGLMADHSGGRTKITLAREAYGVARKALELDSLHGGAHHIVGRLHSGAKRLSWVSRVIARGLGLGTVIDEASWESAEHHLRRGAALDPEPLVHHLELAKLLLNLGKEDEGFDRLGMVASREPRYALDTLYIREAREVLSRLRSSGQPPPPVPRDGDGR